MRASGNPYRVQRLEALLKYDPALVGSSWEEIERALSVGSGAVVGLKGSGKTNLLEAFTERAKASMAVKMWRLGSGSVSRDILDEVEDWIVEGDLAVVDSAGLLSFRQIRRLRDLARKNKIVVSLHQESRNWKTLWSCRANADLLSHLNERLGQGELEGYRASELLERYDGNIRLCFHALYDVVSQAE